MKDIYNYNKNININKTPNGDVVITMNKQILTSIINHIHDASEHQKEQGYEATAEDTKELWEALYNKEHEAFGEQ